MNKKTLLHYLLAIVMPALAAGAVAYCLLPRPANQAESTAASHADVADAIPTAPARACADHPPAIPDSGWDAVATVPGTSVTFRYPSAGFFGQAPVLKPLAGTTEGLGLGIGEEPTDAPFVYPSLTPYLAVEDKHLTEDDIVTSAVTDYETEYLHDTWSYAMRVNGRPFLISANGTNRLFFTASTPYRGKTLTVTINPWSICDFGGEQYAPPLLYDFLAHLEFGDAPVR